MVDAIIDDITRYMKMKMVQHIMTFPQYYGTSNIYNTIQNRIQ